MAQKYTAIALSVLLALTGCGSDDNKNSDNGCVTDCGGEVENQAPSVQITSPASELEVAISEPLLIEMDASDPDGEVVEAKLFWNGAYMGSLYQAPFTLDEFYVPINTPEGANTLSVTVVDDRGATASHSTQVQVNAALKPPTVTLLSPNAETPLLVNEEALFSAEATAKGDASIVKVEYLFNGELIAESTEAPTYNASYTPNEAGLVKLSVVATDDQGKQHQIDTLMHVSADPADLLVAPDHVYFKSLPPYDTLTVYWNDNTLVETGFVIQQRFEDSNEWTELDAADADTTELTISTFDRSDTRDIRVLAMVDESASTPSETVRIAGTDDTLEVSSVVPDIMMGSTLKRTKEVYNAEGAIESREITFPQMQYQTPIEPDLGQATRVSTYFTAQVTTSSTNTDLIQAPVYETRPQIRNFLTQKDPAHSYRDNGLSGHLPYGYALYGPVEGDSGSSLHNKHWINIDASEEIVVRVTLATDKGAVDLADLEIHPEPLDVARVDGQTFDITLPGATDFTRHYRVAVNRMAWSSAPETATRGEIIIESPLFIFVNPMHVAPGSAPEGEIVEFDNGALVVFGPGIHLPNPDYQFYGEGANETAREVYAPGDAYLHYGFLLKNDSYPLKLWGRAIYSDEMFNLYTGDTANDDGYVWSERARSYWSHLDAIEGNPWGITQDWDTHTWLQGAYSAEPTVFEGFTNVGARMGVMAKTGSSEIRNHKDVGYAGGTYQSDGAEVYYSGNLLINDDDITYVHENYVMENNTSFVMHNGPSFQLGWEAEFDGDLNILTQVRNHTVLSSDRKDTSFWKNHGVFDSRLQLGLLKNHSGGVFEDFEFYGQETVIFNIRIWDEGDEATDTVSMISDKTFKNFNIRQASYNQEELLTESNTSLNKQAYLRFFHFDNLVIENQLIDDISLFSQYFDYDDGLLLHTLTLFSLPDAVNETDVINGVNTAPIGQYIAMSANNGAYVQSDQTLPQSLDPLVANTTDLPQGFIVTDAGDGYIALMDYSGRYIQADPARYGYVHVQPVASKEISEAAKFVWVDLGGQAFALYSKSMQLYVRIDTSSSANAPLYAASDSITSRETFSFDSHTGEPPMLGTPPTVATINAALFDEQSGGIQANGTNTAIGYIKADRTVSYDLNTVQVEDEGALKISLAGTRKAQTEITVLVDGATVGVGTIASFDADYVMVDLDLSNVGSIGRLTLSFDHATDGGFLTDVTELELTYTEQSLNSVTQNMVFADNAGLNIAQAKDNGQLESLKPGAWVKFDLPMAPVGGIKATLTHQGGSGGTATFYGVLSDTTEELLGEIDIPTNGGWSAPLIEASGILDAARTADSYQGFRMEIDSPGNYCCNIGSLVLEYQE
ncbi:Ig-like domain-containing protein [Echinimonas agarilytica]|uniref:Ig-like domain-containing protein n=1 Tax=Echinimonas agarilytica TaxID=1215918 RepID=A0AA41WA75_9GAMM|nr:Ig-like domain-containing protein [Echinimonas agarilytica]MCM2681525.1 Ig-like domain-containing protein [Echinimonas agarilytica]